MARHIKTGPGRWAVDRWGKKWASYLVMKIDNSGTAIDHQTTWETHDTYADAIARADRMALLRSYAGLFECDYGDEEELERMERKPKVTGKPIRLPNALALMERGEKSVIEELPAIHACALANRARRDRIAKMERP